jgi:hypothetical protein
VGRFGPVIQGFLQRADGHEKVYQILRDAGHMLRIRGLKLMLSALGLLSLGTSSVFGVTDNDSKTLKTWTWQWKELKPSLDLSIDAKVENLKVPVGKLKTRLKKWQDDDRIEPLYIPISKYDPDFEQTAKRFARQGKEVDLFNFIKNNYSNAQPLKPNAKQLHLPLTKSAFRYVDQESFL